MRRQLSLLFCLLYFIGCNPHDESSSFWDKSEQTANTRIISGSFEVTDSLNLNERFGILNPTRLHQNEDFFIIADRPSSDYALIYIITKSSLSLHQTIRISYGRGPGEVEPQSLRSLAVNQGNVLLSDMNQQKIVRFDLDGNFIHEVVTDFFISGKNAFRSDGLMLLFSNPIRYLGNPLFFLINTDGQPEGTFGDINEQDFNHLSLYGYLDIDEHDNLYYAGFAEHIIKKFSPQGEELFSVGTVGNPESDFNYISSVSGETLRIMGYAEGAYYSATHLFVCGDFLCVEHAGDVDFEPSSYVDLYDRDDGTYQFSYIRPTHRARGMLMSDGFYYTLHYFDDDIHLVRYSITE
ncbi:MAG: hypothetical protein JJU41_03755 [Bacteroidetes bacterium]|nr:hypothetical protein [Bacteroidota bacterium]